MPRLTWLLTAKSLTTSYCRFTVQRIKNSKQHVILLTVFLGGNFTTLWKAKCSMDSFSEFTDMTIEQYMYVVFGFLLFFSFLHSDLLLYNWKWSCAKHFAKYALTLITFWSLKFQFHSTQSLTFTLCNDFEIMFIRSKNVERKHNIT